MAEKQQVIKDLDRVISLIKTDSKDIPAEEKKQMVADTLDRRSWMWGKPSWIIRRCIPRNCLIP